MSSACFALLISYLGGLLSVTQVEGGFNDCFFLCDSDTNCLGWTYSGSVNTTDSSGSCYLKDASDGGNPTFAGSRLNVSACTP